MGMESFNGTPEKKPETLTQETVNENNNDELVSEISQDIKDFSHTREGKRTMKSLDKSNISDDIEGNVQFNKEQDKEKYEKNAEVFAKEIQERLNATQEKITSIMKRFKNLSESKKKLTQDKWTTKIGAFGYVGYYASIVGGMPMSLDLLTGIEVLPDDVRFGAFGISMVLFLVSSLVMATALIKGKYHNLDIDKDYEKEVNINSEHLKEAIIRAENSLEIEEQNLKNNPDDILEQKEN